MIIRFTERVAGNSTKDCSKRDWLRSDVWALCPISPLALPVIGYLSSRSAEAETTRRTGFLDGLEQQGFVVGQNIAIEYRYAEGQPDRLPALAAELVGLPAALLVATGAPAAVAAKEATATIPIVFSVGPDPVQLGLVASFNRPAGNATGASGFGTEVIPKRLNCSAKSSRSPV